MTTIAYRAGVMAADTQVTAGIIVGTTTKIVRRKDGALCAGVGSLPWVQAFHRWFMAGEEGDPPEVPEDSRGLIIGKRGPFEMFETNGAFEIKEPFIALGTGREFALGAMYVGATAAAAVKAAMEFDPYSGGKVMTLTHDKA